MILGEILEVAPAIGSSVCWHPDRREPKNNPLKAVLKIFLFQVSTLRGFYQFFVIISAFAFLRKRLFQVAMN